MIIHTLTIIFVIFVVEMLLVFKLFKKINITISTSEKIIKCIMSKKASSQRKEKKLLRYSGELSLNILKIVGIFIIISSFYLITDYFYQSFSNYFLSIYGILESIIVVYVYILLKKLIYGKL